MNPKMLLVYIPFTQRQLRGRLWEGGRRRERGERKRGEREKGERDRKRKRQRGREKGRGT